jgi:uncharacterized protein (TIGR03435 family)
MQRAPFLAWFSFSLVCALATTAAAQSAVQPHRRAVHEDHAALPYQVHIAPSTLPEGSTSIETAGDSWVARGYDLRTLIAQIYNVDVRRVDFPDSVADKRFDISVDLPVEVGDSTMQQLLQDAVQTRFGLHIAQQSRPMNVYVLSAPNGPGAAMKRHPVRMSAMEVAGFSAADAADNDADSGRITVFGQNCTERGSSAGISVSGGSMADLRHTLEPDLDRVLLDETHLAGSYDFTVGNYTSQQELFRLLHDQLGLVVTSAQRNVTVLAVRPAGTQNQTLEAKLLIRN